MHTIAFTVSKTQYNIVVDDFFYYDGLVCSPQNFGEFLVMFYDIALNDFAKKINFPIKNLSVNREEAIKTYIEDCQWILSKNYNPIIVSLMLNEIEDSLLNAKSQDANIEMNKIFQAYAIMQICIKEFLQGNWTKLEKILVMQQISTKFILTDKGQMQQVFFLKDIYSLLCMELLNLQTHNITIKVCENCNRPFITQNRTDEIYCDRIFKNGKTCKNVGYIEKVKKHDEFMQAYTKARKTQHARIKYNSHITDYKAKHYEPWKVEAEKARENFRNKNDIKGFLKWLDEHKNSF